TLTWQPVFCSNGFTHWSSVYPCQAIRFSWPSAGPTFVGSPFPPEPALLPLLLPPPPPQPAATTASVPVATASAVQRTDRFNPFIRPPPFPRCGSRRCALGAIPAGRAARAPRAPGRTTSRDSGERP